MRVAVLVLRHPASRPSPVVPEMLRGLTQRSCTVEVLTPDEGVLDLAEQRGAHNVRVFGSVARGQDTDTSDIDLLVDLDDGVSLVGLAGLRRQLSDLLKVEVDVVPAATLKPNIAQAVLAEAVTL